jgi:hypothetical protein
MRRWEIMKIIDCFDVQSWTYPAAWQQAHCITVVSRMWLVVSRVLRDVPGIITGRACIPFGLRQETKGSGGIQVLLFFDWLIGQWKRTGAKIEAYRFIKPAQENKVPIDFIPPWVSFLGARNENDKFPFYITGCAPIILWDVPHIIKSKPNIFVNRSFKLVCLIRILHRVNVRHSWLPCWVQKTMNLTRKK